jgi:hypothetical protein
MTNNKFDLFVPAILKTYHRDKEAFWDAVMAPFMSETTMLSLWKHRKVNYDLLLAFQGLDDQAKQILKEFSTPMGVDVTNWKNNRPQYFKDAYPIFAFLAVWMDEMGLSEFLEQFSTVLRSAVFGVAGYGILDMNVDGASSSPVEILTAQALIAEYETLILQVFGVTPINLEVLNRMRRIFLNAEIKEKSMRGKASPYTIEKPEDCGAKGAHVVTPFMLSLERLGQAHLIDDYWRVFLLFGAVIQVIDDWTDLEGDLSVGHYSYVSLGSKIIKEPSQAKQNAKILRSDADRVVFTHERSKEMIAEARTILNKLNDPILMRLVDVTDLRLDTYFRKELKFNQNH